MKMRRGFFDRSMLQGCSWVLLLIAVLLLALGAGACLLVQWLHAHLH